MTGVMPTASGRLGLVGAAGREYDRRHHERRHDPHPVPKAVRLDGRAGRALRRDRPPPGAGRGGCAQQEAEHRRDRRRRHGGREPEGLREREHRRPLRRRPAATRRRPSRSTRRRSVLHRLPGDAREAEGHRRGGDRDAGPHARGDHHGRHAGRQARLLPEAADPHGLRGPQDHRGGRGEPKA